MGKTGRPRHGSMQFWPRRRAASIVARVRAWAEGVKEARLLGFAGYKAGMTHIFVTDNNKNSTTKGQSIRLPVTVIECPPLSVYSIKFYKQTLYGKKLVSEVLSENIDKEFFRKSLKIKNRNKKLDDVSAEIYDFIRLGVYTHPKQTGIGRKKPEIFEVALGGNKDDQLNYAKEKLGKKIDVSEVFSEGNQIDIHSVTKGKGVQGPVKRFGITIQGRKKEKTRRQAGSLGGWKAQGHVMYRVPQAGQTGFHRRTEYNKIILKIGDNAEEVNPKGGFLRYGLVKNNYVLIRGSVGGSRNRIIRFNAAIRPNKKLGFQSPAIESIDISSKQ